MSMSHTVEAITGSARDSLHEVKEAVHRATKAVDGAELHRRKKSKAPMRLLAIAAVVVAVLVLKKVRGRGADDSYGTDVVPGPTTVPAAGDGMRSADAAAQPIMHAVPD
jgi:hypothetical protein